MVGSVPASEHSTKNFLKSYWKISRGKIKALTWGILLSAALMTQVSHANALQMDFDHEFSSGTPPAGSPPWLRAVFSSTTPGSVSLTLSTVNLTDSEFVSGWYFNLNPALDPTTLSFTTTSSAGDFTAPAILTDVNAFKADGDGKYDILFNFATSGARFTAGDSLTINITGISTLTADDFNFLSAPAGGHGPYTAAAHVQSISGGYSGWVDPTLVQSPGDNTQVPDGGVTAILLGFSLVAIEGFRRRLSSGLRLN